MSNSARDARVIVVGGGVVGCAILRAFAEAGVTDAILIETERDVGEGASRANSAIVHTGFDAKPGTTEARMLRRAAALWPDTVEALGVPFLAVGALMLARSPEEAEALRGPIRSTAESHGVATELIDRSRLRSMAPYLTEDAVAALSIPDEAVIDPFWLTRAYAEAAAMAGSIVRRDTAVTGIRLLDDRVDVDLADGSTLTADQVVDAAGLHAHDVAAMAGDRSFAISPRRGQFLVSEETFGVDRIVLPVPGPMGKGLLVTPIVFGGLLLGPTATDTTDKDDRSTDAETTARILATCAGLVPAMAEARPVRAFAGNRPVSSTGDYVLGPSTAGDRMWLACGIRSTGISTSPAVAEAVVEGVLAARGWAARPVSAPAPGFGFDEPPGEVVCLCRGVSAGEIDAACRRPLAPLTLDAVKRRGGAMFGDCQGNLCAVAVSGRLAAARGADPSTIEKGPRGSWLFAGRTGTPTPVVGAPDDGAAADVGDDETVFDVVVVGLGHAGAAALGAARDAGRSVLGLDRRHGWTVIGLAQAFDGDGWTVEAQGTNGPIVRRAAAIVLATGGYVRPREHRAIDGPRPSGVITADFADSALGAGLLPGRRAVVVGTNDRAARTAAALSAAGCEIVARLDAAPTEIRGRARLEAVRAGTDPDAWIDADTLVLADELIAQPFLLRPWGFVDGRPGTRAPVDADGRLPAPGLWAVGCCVAPDIDHRGCAAAGAAVGTRVVASLPIPAS